DGRPVKGFSSQVAPPGGAKDEELSPDAAGGHTHGEFDQDAPYHAAVVGTTPVRGKVVDADGKGVANAKVRVERAFGESVEVETDGSGGFTAYGFVEE